MKATTERMHNEVVKMLELVDEVVKRLEKFYGLIKEIENEEVNGKSKRDAETQPGGKYCYTAGSPTPGVEPGMLFDCGELDQPGEEGDKDGTTTGSEAADTEVAAEHGDKSSGTEQADS